jgi:flagellar hook-associated protein 1
MGLFDALGIGMRGLHAAQTAIDVTGQNISNANTEGYSRKRVILEADAVRDDIYGQKGIGVEVMSVARIRDEFLDRQTWEQVGEKGLTTEMFTAYTRLESILKEPSDTGLSNQMNKFWASWQDLANNPGNPSAREAVKATATVLTDSLHSAYKQIEDYGLSMNNPLIALTKSVNAITGQIYQLNEQIAGEEARPGQKANDSRDQRDILTRKLAELIDVQTVEDVHGRILISSGANVIVGPSEALQIEVYGVDSTLSDGTANSELRLKFSSSGKSFEPVTGSLRGIMNSRSMILKDAKESLNVLTKGLVTQVNDIHSKGYTLNKQTGVFFFDPNKVQAGDIQLSDAIKNDSKNIAAAAGGKINDVTAFLLSGVGSSIPAVGSSLDLKTINPLYQDVAEGSVKLTLPGGVVLEEGAGKDYIVEYATGKITFLNYAKYAVGGDLTVKMAYNAAGYPGDGNGQSAADIARVRLTKSLSPDGNGAMTQSLTDYYGSVIGRMGIEKNQVQARKETREFLIAQMDSEQAAVSGVSMDEEMTNMIKFQNSYKASAKYIQTISDMMDILLSIK